jgi:hypothetical protein
VLPFRHTPSRRDVRRLASIRGCDIRLFGTYRDPETTHSPW